MTTERTNYFRIGYFARRYGVSTEAIRLWERQGLMPPARRTPGGHRRYGAEHRQALDAIIIPAVNDAGDDRSRMLQGVA